MSDDDLIRRGDALFIVRSTVDIECADAATLLVRLSGLPADPVAEAAIRLAEAEIAEEDAWEAWHEAMRSREPERVAKGDAAQASLNATTRARDEALAAYRAAVEARR